MSKAKIVELVLEFVIELELELEFDMIDDEAKKVIWSLQHNKRTEAERNVFAPTGKKPMNKNVVYVLSAIAIVFLMSFALSQFSKETTHFCFLIESYCFNSTENPLAYTFYIFMNLWILILGIGIQCRFLKDFKVVYN